MSVAPSPLRTEPPQFAFDFDSAKKDSYHPPASHAARSATFSASFELTHPGRMRTMKQIIIKTARGFVYLYGNDYIEVIV